MPELIYKALSPDQVYGFLFVFLRISTILFLLPLLGSVNLPTTWKAGFALLLAVLLSEVVPRHPLEIHGPLALALTVAAELLMGLVLGLSVRLIFTSFQLAGQVIGFQMGFSIVNIVDPQSGNQASILAQFNYILAILVFLTIHGHHHLIQALVRSFELVPPGAYGLNTAVYEQVLTLSSQMFTVAVRIAAPAMTALLLTSTALGIVCKTVPQINILIVGFPLKIGIGLLLFGLSMGTVLPYFVRLLSRLLPILEVLTAAGTI
jgi:flagellar biosynthetic protein FliR